jgi:DivIVA domain-containing protein
VRRRRRVGSADSMSRRHSWHHRRVLILEIVVILAVVFAVSAVAAGYGGGLTRFHPDWPGRGLPEGRPIRAEDLDAVRFSLAFRGYRMAEVDEVIDRLRHALAERDAVLERLGVDLAAELGAGQPAPPSAAESAAAAGGHDGGSETEVAAAEPVDGDFAHASDSGAATATWQSDRSTDAS